jgi:hypothetical protein
LVRDRRTGDNPLAHLSGGNVELDRRHDRRVLPIEELRLLLETASNSTPGPSRSVRHESRDAIRRVDGHGVADVGTGEP